MVEVIAPFGGHDTVVADLKAKVFATEPIKMVAMAEGRREIRSIHVTHSKMDRN